MKNKQRLKSVVLLLIYGVFLFSGIFLTIAPATTSALTAKDCHSDEYFVPASSLQGPQCLKKSEHPRNASDCPKGTTYVASSPFGGAAFCQNNAPKSQKDCPSGTTFDNQVTPAICQKNAPTSQKDCKSTEYFVPATSGTVAQPAQCLSKADHPRNSGDCPKNTSYVPASNGVAATCQANSSSTDPTGTDNKSLDCDLVGYNPLTWIICPVIDVLAGIIDVLDNLVTSQLSISSNDIFCDSGNQTGTCTAYYQAWATFRNIALGLTAIAGLIVVISQALGFEILDAYTIRKVLPRLLVAVVGITLSWPLMKLAINFTNDLGHGVRHLIYAPFSNLPDKLDLSFGGKGFDAAFGTTAFVALLPTAVIGSVVFIGIILSYAATGALAVFIAVLVLVLRQVLITLLLLMAPIAIITYVFPNTQRMYKLWWESFIKALLMFPLIAGFIAAGRVFSAIALNSGGLLNQMVGFAAYFAPYFLIPATFKLAGGALRQIGGFVNDRSRGAFDRLRNNRANQMKGIGQDWQSGQLTRRLGPSRPEAFKRFDRVAQRARMAGSAGVNPAHWRGRVGQARKAYDAHKLDDIDKESEMALIRGYDNLGEVAELAGGHRGRMDDILRARGFDDRQRSNMLDAWQVAQSGLSSKGYSNEAILQGAGMLNGLKAKTAHTQEGFDYADDHTYMGGVRVLEAVARQSGNDSNTEASLIGRSLDAQGSAGRQILPGFSSSLVALDKIKKINSDPDLTPEAREAKLKDVAHEMNATTVYKEGVSAALGKTAHDTRHLIPTYDRLLKEAYAQHEEAKTSADHTATISRYNPETDRMESVKVSQADAKDHLMSVAAQVAYMQQVNQSMPIEKQGQVSALLQHTVGTRADGTEYTFQQFINDSRGDADMARHMFDIISQREREHRDSTDDLDAAEATRRTGGSGTGGMPSSGTGGGVTPMV